MSDGPRPTILLDEDASTFSVQGVDLSVSMDVRASGITCAIRKGSFVNGIFQMKFPWNGALSAPHIRQPCIWVS